MYPRIAIIHFIEIEYFEMHIQNILSARLGTNIHCEIHNEYFVITNIDFRFAAIYMCN